jgi:glycosyltransferase involved in cell wall biosynthesis
MNAPDRLVVLFVGGFRVPKSGTEGGQVFASRSLVDSPLKEHIRWILVDTTQRSEPPPGMLIRLFDAARRMLQVVWRLAFYRVDVVLTFSNFMPLSILEKGSYCLMGRMLGKQTVMSFRFHPSIPARFSRFFRWYIRAVCLSCHRIICQSQIAADELIRLFGVDSNRIEVIHNWIDTSRFRNPPPRKPAPEGITRIIYAGWLHPKKGVEYLMPAMRLLADRRSDFKLTICGSGSHFEAVQRQRREWKLEPLVEVLGWVKNEEVFQRFFDSDIFLLPSLAEGMPNALLQAMGCGLPVVTTNVSSIPAIVEDGRNGSLIEPKSAQAICDGLLRLMDRRSEWVEIGERNRQQVLANHDIATVWPRIGAVLGLRAPSPDSTESSRRGQLT